MGTKSNPAPNDCYAKALPDEPMFVLLARDPDAARVVRFWAGLRARRIDEGTSPKSDEDVVTEALNCANAMRTWRVENKDIWRPSAFQSPDGVGDGPYTSNQKAS